MFENKNIYHFYHIYADASWHNPLRQQIAALRSSKLIDEIETIKIGVVGNNENFNEVKQYLNNENINYEVVDHKQTGWEQVTQNKLYEFAQENDGLVLYSHTKGSSTRGPELDRWRETMIYYNVIRWKECVEALKTHDTAGCLWMTPKPSMTEHHGHKSFYAGTFWWANLEYIRSLQYPGMEHRWRAEGWIGLSDTIKPFAFSLEPEFGNWIELAPYINE